MRSHVIPDVKSVCDIHITPPALNLSQDQYVTIIPTTNFFNTPCVLCLIASPFPWLHKNETVRALISDDVLI